MTARAILKWPNQKLLKQSVQIKKIEQEELQLFHDLHDTVRVNYGAGLALPQIGVLRRACIISAGYVPSLESDPLFDSFVILVNPEITVSSEEKFTWKEACLSIDDFDATVKRHQAIEVKYQNSQGEIKTAKVTGMESATIQHETDHLDGKLFIHRLTGYTKLSAMNKLKKRSRKQKSLLKAAQDSEKTKIGKPKRNRKKKKKMFGQKKKR